MPNPTPTPAGMTAEDLREKLLALADGLNHLNHIFSARHTENELRELATRLSGMAAVPKQAENIALLSEHVPLSECYISEFGTFCCDFDSDPENQLSLMVASDGGVAFASYVSGERRHSQYTDCAGALPQVVLSAIAARFPEPPHG